MSDRREKLHKFRTSFRIKIPLDEVKITSFNESKEIVKKLLLKKKSKKCFACEC